MRSNAEQNITTTTYVHNSYRGRPSSQVLNSAICSKVVFGREGSKSKDELKNKVSLLDSEEPINLCLSCHVEENDSAVT